ncbi:hypothetical protein NQZ68_012125 [Dissostichus eleginoides]|nr:hypothetical protein NQZ68_012125 [Dissostichus eleginoides]
MSEVNWVGANETREAILAQSDRRINALKGTDKGQAVQWQLGDGVWQTPRWRSPHTHQLLFSRGSLDAKQERKMTSVLSSYSPEKRVLHTGILFVETCDINAEGEMLKILSSLPPHPPSSSFAIASPASWGEFFSKGEREGVEERSRPCVVLEAPARSGRLGRGEGPQPGRRYSILSHCLLHRHHAMTFPRDGSSELCGPAEGAPLIPLSSHPFAPPSSPPSIHFTCGGQDDIDADALIFPDSLRALKRARSVNAVLASNTALSRVGGGRVSISPLSLPAYLPQTPLRCNTLCGANTLPSSVSGGADSGGPSGR